MPKFERIRYLCQDECGTILTLSGVKPLGTWQWQFRAFWLYGAIEPTTEEQFFWQFSHVDSDCCQRFLNEFSATYADTLNKLLRR